MPKHMDFKMNFPKDTPLVCPHCGRWPNLTAVADGEAAEGIARCLNCGLEEQREMFLIAGLPHRPTKANAQGVHATMIDVGGVRIGHSTIEGDNRNVWLELLVDKWLPHKAIEVLEHGALSISVGTRTEEGLEMFLLSLMQTAYDMLRESRRKRGLQPDPMPVHITAGQVVSRPPWTEVINDDQPPVVYVAIEGGAFQGASGTPDLQVYVNDFDVSDEDEKAELDAQVAEMERLTAEGKIKPLQ